MAATPLGFPSPDDDDPVDVPADIRALALALDTHLTPEVASPVVATGFSGYISLYRIGALVVMNSTIIRTTGPTSTGDDLSGIVIGTVPVGMRPTTTIFMPPSSSYGNSSAKHHCLVRGSNGNIELAYNEATGTLRMRLSLVWATVQ